MNEREQALEEAAAMLEGWVEHDDKVGDHTSADALSVAAACIRELKIPSKMLYCCCEPCKTLVEAWSRSGMCGPCCAEDCEHDEDEGGL